MWTKEGSGTPHTVYQHLHMAQCRATHLYDEVSRCATKAVWLQHLGCAMSQLKIPEGRIWLPPSGELLWSLLAEGFLHYLQNVHAL